MDGIMAELAAHLASGSTTTCRCWAVTRRDGVTLGFTDHDQDLVFEDLRFAAGTGLTARSLAQSTGLSVDNSEALGVLSSTAVREEDIDAGRFDAAELRAWLVNWADVTQRHLLFRGSLGEIRRAGGGFEAELRGLTEVLNQPVGRVYQRPCTAVLGGSGCEFDLSTVGYSHEMAYESGAGDRFSFASLDGFAAGWFTHGRLMALSGAAAGLSATVKRDEITDEGRILSLWHPLGATVAAGDVLRLEAGCDKKMSSCRFKFDNLINYQGFPDIPGEDWLATVPRATGRNQGGSLR